MASRLFLPMLETMGAEEAYRLDEAEHIAMLCASKNKHAKRILRGLAKPDPYRTLAHAQLFVRYLEREHSVRIHNAEFDWVSEGATQAECLDRLAEIQKRRCFECEGFTTAWEQLEKLQCRVIAERIADA